MRKATIMLFVLAVFCNVALADSYLTVRARRIIAQMDRIQRTLKPIWQSSNPPAEASERLRTAWYKMIRTAKEAYWCSEYEIRCAEKIEHDDESEETIAELSKLLHKFNMVLNAFEEAMDEVRRIQQQET